jgi:hypothetical protein
MSTLNGGPGNIVTNGLVLYLDAANYLSYVSGSTTWRDISSSNLSGSLINGPTFSSGNGGSIVFDGVDDYVNATSSLYVDNFTLNAWVYKTTSGIQTIIAKGNASFQLNFYLRIAGNSGFFGTSGGFTEISVADLTLNTWNNTVLTYDKNNLKYFLNGVFINQISATNTPILSSSNTIIGRLGDFNGQYWTGRIASTSIYNRALTASEILQNYNSTKARFGL